MLFAEKIGKVVVEAYFLDESDDVIAGYIVNLLIWHSFICCKDLIA